MTKMKLTYFDFSGSRGEECRLAFAIAGVDFEDNRLSREEWKALKPNTPFGSMPLLDEEGHPTLSQANAILELIGRRYGLLPTDDDWEAARIMSLLSAAEELRYRISNTFSVKDEDELKKIRTELLEGPIKSWAANMEKQIKGPYAAGEKVTVADIKLFIIIGWIKKGVLSHVPADCLNSYAKLEKLYDKVNTHPRIVEWYKKSSQ